MAQMWNQEKDHLKKFNELMVAYRVRPTVLLPFWNVAGFVLGAGSALLGKKGAMACTVAVEESISEHYNNQIRTLIEEDPEKYKELLQVIKQFRDDEQEHHDIGLEHDAEATPAYSVLKTAIQLGCKAAIFLSERIYIQYACGKFPTPLTQGVGDVPFTQSLLPEDEVVCSAYVSDRQLLVRQKPVHTLVHWH
ncbi:hypothetical protein IHE44_0004247 [Lamprotornis superbus]|uniref:Ubiquinone biosynthesis monooxygenase COQ7 n=1 Tax=Lamprotornis superbus TaxID=245042 RepID=A0A835NP27_9PASS|nr:hypothetical protein IHE44_0004247 [Lamprotornis superbus]